MKCDRRGERGKWVICLRMQQQSSAVKTVSLILHGATLRSGICKTCSKKSLAFASPLISPPLFSCHPDSCPRLGSRRHHRPVPISGDGQVRCVLVSLVLLFIPVFLCQTCCHRLLPRLALENHSSSITSNRMAGEGHTAQAAGTSYSLREKWS